jgi:maltose O-acetyltransferase
MTEGEKALAGLDFVKGDPELRKMRERAESLCFRLNHTPPEEGETRQKLLLELIPDQGEGCTVKPPFLCDYGRFIRMGDRVFINYGCKLVDGGMIHIGNDVLIAPGCTITTANHAVDPVRRQKGYMRLKPVTIGNNVWIGAGVTICPGVTIGRDSVIGAGSVVVKDIPEDCIAVGNPCRVIGKASEKEI